MTTMTEQLTEAEARILEGLATLHEQLVEVNEQAAERLQQLSVPTPEVEPLIEPADAIAHYYDFAGKVLEANRKFAEQVVKAWYPAPRPAKKTTASKSRTAAKK